MACFKIAVKNSTQLYSFSLTTNSLYLVSLDVSSMHLAVAHTTRSLGKFLYLSFFSARKVINPFLSPPKKRGVDDVTGEPLIQRSDDNVETLRKRLATFHAQTGPVAEYYKSKGLWQGIDAAQSPTVVWDNLWSIFRK
jgi:adenylate kinase family enzyme